MLIVVIVAKSSTKMMTQISMMSMTRTSMTYHKWVVLGPFYQPPTEGNMVIPIKRTMLQLFQLKDLFSMLAFENPHNHF